MTDSELREAAERVQAWSRFMTFGVNSFTTKNQMAEAMDAVASKLLELLPPASGDNATTAPPFDAWCFIRDVLRRGAQIERECDPNQGYERFSAKLDSAARDLADRLKPHLRATP